MSELLFTADQDALQHAQPEARVVPRAAEWLAVVACLVLHVALRARGVGHLLMWDEARDVLASQALAGGGGDTFAARLWVHPPAIPVLSLLMQPLIPGFAERYEMLVIAINACAMVALFLLNRRIYGVATALWSCFFLAVMPGALFFDVWIKGGAVVTLATIGAVAALMGGKALLCGLCLGFALLDKETAALSCVAVGMLALLDSRHRTTKTIFAMVLTTLFTAGWWYAIFSTTVKQWLKCATGNAWDASCAMPWYKYFEWLYGDLGAAGSVLLLLGVASLAGSAWRERVKRVVRPYTWWPILLTVVTYGVLTACRNKSSWFAMFAYPALATVQAVGITATARACSARVPRLRHVWHALVAACAGYMLVVAIMQRHEGVLRRMKYWEGPFRTREIARAVNERIGPEERLLATTLSFYGPAGYKLRSPIFDYYLTNVHVQTPMVSCQASFDDCTVIIITNRFDWALLTPEPGAPAAALTNGFKSRFKLDPIILDNGTSFLYRTTSMYRQGD